MTTLSLAVLAATEGGLMALLIALVVGGLIGWVASIVMGTNAQMGWIANVVVGIVGSILGHYLAGVFGIAESGQLARILVSIGGAVLLIVILRGLKILR